MNEWQISIEGKVSQPVVKEAVCKFGLSPFKNQKGYTGYYANVDEATANEFAKWFNEVSPASTWIDTQRIFN